MSVSTIKDKVNVLAEKNVDSTDSDVRYMAYAARLRTALRAGHRYVAYVRSGPLFFSWLSWLTKYID